MPGRNGVLRVRLMYKITQTSPASIIVDELAFFSDNAKVRTFDSEWRCIKCEIFRIKLSHFIHVHFRTFALSHFITSRYSTGSRNVNTSLTCIYVP